MRLLFLFVLLLLILNSRVFSYYDVDTEQLYEDLSLHKKGLSYEAFRHGVIGFYNLQKEMVTPKDILAIADYSQSSKSKRFYIIDMSNSVLLLQTYVAHGRNSGDEFAQYFSNEFNSYQTSLGFYETLYRYHGENGLSLKLTGLDDSFNNNAYERLIVLHGAWYVSKEHIDKWGRLGRSLGCPAVPEKEIKYVVDILEANSIIFHYYPDPIYLDSSIWLKEENEIYCLM